ncbi:hypothetical protein Ndes2437B_g07111 [Nannochloris sp. 'desiccata']
MSLQIYFATILVFIALVIQTTQAARPDIFRSEDIQKFPIRPISSEDPAAIFRKDVGISTKIDRRKLLTTSTSNRTTTSTEERVATGRVANGQRAAKGQFPFVAYFDPEGVCTASLISPRAALSAAHCVYEDGVWSRSSKSAIYIGSNYWYDDDMLEYRVKGVWIPEVYEKGNGYGLYGDIAVVGLTTAVPSSVSKPVTMASASTSLAGVKELTLIGWGQLESGKMPDYLYYAALRYNKQQCMAIYNELFEGEPIEKDHICTGGAKSPLIQSCGGDSGGPTVLERPGKKPVQIAVTSYGYGDHSSCGKIDGQNINVDTSVAYWRTWIEDILSYQNLRGTTPPVRMNTVEYGTCYSGTGAALKTLKVGAGYKCCDACRANAACKAWTHVKSSSMCFLLPGKGKSVKIKDCTSGWYK